MRVHLFSRLGGGSRRRRVGWYHALPGALVFFTATGLSQNAGVAIAPRFAPAYYSGTQSESPQIVVFPPGRESIVIPLRVPNLLRYLAFTRDGRQIFGTINTMRAPKAPGHGALPGSPRLVRVDIESRSVTTVADLVGLDGVLGLAVTPRGDRIFVAGTGWMGKVGCDLFAIDTAGKNMRLVVPNFGCKVGGVSPDGDKMLVPRGAGLDVVDIATGAGVPLGNGFWKGDWSPNGRWIAALRTDPGIPAARSRLSKTVLIDANDLSQRKVMGGGSDNEVTWSPDSRYLLYSAWEPPCPKGGDDPSLLIMDVETGKRGIVGGSRCKVNPYRYVGWVSLDVLQEQ